MKLSVVNVGAMFVALAVASCDNGSRPAAAAQNAGATRVRDSSADPMDALQGLKCEPARAGHARSCSADGYLISGTSTNCDNDTASLGSVVERSTLVAQFPSSAAPAPVATLSPGQLVCIQYSADSDRAEEGWSYVTAIQPSMVSACKDNCSAGATGVEWKQAKPTTPCSPTRAGYSAGCASGWMRTRSIDPYSMGLPAPVKGRPLDRDAVSLAHSLPGVTINAVAQNGKFMCIAGAKSDELGQEAAVVAGFGGGSSSPQWVSSIPRDPDFYQNRATHCACTDERCYALVATDTQPAQATSQTLLSVVRLSRAGALVETRDLDRVPGAPANATAWVEPGSSNFLVEGNALVIRGMWRNPEADAAHPFTTTIPLF